MKVPFHFHVYYLLSILTTLAFSQTRSGGVTPTQPMTILPYFMVERCQISATSLGLPLLASTPPLYTLSVPFTTLMPSVNRNVSRVITSEFESYANVNLAYAITSVIGDSPTSVVITLVIMGDSELFRLGMGVLRVSDSMSLKNFYLTLANLTSTSPTSPVYITTSNITGYTVYPLIQSISITLTTTAPLTPQPLGFTTIITYTVSPTSGPQFKISFLKDDSMATYYDITVTWVVLMVNEGLWKVEMAQFTNLELVVGWWGFLQSGASITLPQYDSAFRSNLIIGVSQLAKLNSHGAYLTYSFSSPSQTSITWLTNTMDGSLKPLLILLTDLFCSLATPYKYKNDPLCYTCPSHMGKIVPINDTNFHEWDNNLTVAMDAGCKRFSRTSSGYEFDRDDGEIVSLCMWCLECNVGWVLAAGKCEVVQNVTNNCTGNATTSCTNASGVCVCTPICNCSDPVSVSNPACNCTPVNCTANCNQTGCTCPQPNCTANCSQIGCTCPPVNCTENCSQIGCNCPEPNCTANCNQTGCNCPQPNCTTCGDPSCPCPAPPPPQPPCTSPTNCPPPQPQNSSTTIIASVVGPLAFVLLSGVGVWCYKRRFNSLVSPSPWVQTQAVDPEELFLDENQQLAQDGGNMDDNLRILQAYKKGEGIGRYIDYALGFIT